LLLVRLWNYLRGYVIILAKGPFLERFLNICTSRYIFLWDVKTARDGSLNLKTSIKGFRSIRPAARKSFTSIRLHGKKGFPFLVKRFKRRKAFTAGLVTFIILINLLTSFIWVVEIDGCVSLKADDIKNELALLGIKPGVFKYNIDVQKATNKIMLDINEIAWVSVEIVGTIAKVSLKEVTKPPELIDTKKTCDIVAERDGIITSMVVMQGNKMVNEGDTVRKGQVLISGSILAKENGKPAVLVHSMGTVKARTWYEKTVDIQYVSKEKVKTGKSSYNIKLIVLGTTLSIAGGKVPYSEYETSQKEKVITLGKDIVLPFGFVNTKYSELVTKEIELQSEDAKEIAVRDSLNELTGEIPADAEIVKQDVYYTDNGDKSRPVSIRTVIECTEDIGVQKGL